MTARNAARTIAVLLLLQMIAGPIVNFRLLLPVIGQSVFLQEAAPHATQIGVAVVLGLVMVGISVGIAVVAWPIFRRHSRAMAFWLLALAIVNLGVGAVEYINTLSMLSLQQVVRERRCVAARHAAGTRRRCRRAADLGALRRAHDRGQRRLRALRDPVPLRAGPARAGRIRRARGRYRRSSRSGCRCSASRSSFR